jgi:hypothetical protein
MKVNLERSLREAMKRDGRTTYALARDAKLRVSIVQKFVKGYGLRLSTASKLCELLGLDLRPVDRETKGK